MIKAEGKVKIGRSVSTCYVEMEQKGHDFIIGSSGTKFIVSVKDLQKALNRDDKAKQGIDAPM